METEHALDLMQCANRAHRGVVDASASLRNLLFQHLEGNQIHARLFFIDVSSAFNTRLIEDFNLSFNLIGRILDFFFPRLITTSQSEWHFI